MSAGASHVFFSSRRRHTRWPRDWSSDVCSSDLYIDFFTDALPLAETNSQFSYEFDVTKIDADDLVTKLIAQSVAGTGTPDVAGIEIGAFTRMLRGEIAPELLVDLTEDIQPYKDDLVAARLTPFSKDDAVYALDSDTPVTVLNYRADERSEEHTSELQSRGHLVCRLLLEKKKIEKRQTIGVTICQLN